MRISNPIIFLHGREGSSQGWKATFLRSRFPDIVIPDFDGDLESRMAQLLPILSTNVHPWTIIGSSFGGLMGALYTCQYPEKVSQLLLLAPALTRPFFRESFPNPVSVPTSIYHGTQDDVVPLEPVRAIATHVFRNLSFFVVDDDHQLHKTVQTIDWEKYYAQTQNW